MSAKAALFDAEGKILGKTTVITRASDGFEGTAEKLADAAKAAAEKAGEVINAAEDLPRSFVLCEEGGERRVWLSSLSSAALSRR